LTRTGRSHVAKVYSSVWKPLRGPLRDWPLALCDYTSLGKGDLVEVDEVHREDILESHGLQYSPEQKWFYLSDQTAEEILIFKSVDSHVKGEGECSFYFCSETCIRKKIFGLIRILVPHAAFKDPRYPYELPRESIELRILVVY
jgi:hypothetical protein